MNGHNQMTYLGRAAGNDLEGGLGVEADVGAAVDLALVPLGGVARRVGRDAARRQPVELLEGKLLKLGEVA